MEEKPKLPAARDLWVEIRPGESLYIGEDVPSYAPLISRFRQIRGNIIACTIDIEYALDSLLVELIDPLKTANSKGIDPSLKKAVEDLKLIVNATWLKSRDTNMRLKIDILDKTTKYHPLLKVEDLGKLVSNLHEVHNIRNDFAHRMMCIRQKKTENGYDWDVYLDFGLRKELLDAAYFKKIEELYNGTMIRLEDLTRKLAAEKKG